MDQQYIIVTDRGIKHLLPLEDILHLESRRIYTIFHIKNARQVISSHNLGRINKELDERFLRIHKSHIVNLYEVKTYKKARGGKITLSDNTIITVAQRRKTELLKHLYQLNKKVKYEKQKIKNDPRAILKTNIAK